MNKKKEVTIRQMPDSAKLISTKVEPWSIISGDLTSSSVLGGAISVSWILSGLTAVSVVFIPNTSELIALSVILAFATAIVGAVAITGTILEGMPRTISNALKTLEDMKPQPQFHLNTVGMKIYSKSGQRCAAFFLPFRIFKKAQMNETITYYPDSDRYAKETHYLGFGGWVCKTEIFDGHRAVFKKALDSF
jgi:hypothetical protein